MTVEDTRVSTRWLALREPADTAARALDLVDLLRRELPSRGPLLIHDLGCGSGAMGRWLAPLLPGPQHWIAHDRDTDLLAAATANLPGPAADGAAVTMEGRSSDVTRLHPVALADATLITASALLDMLTEEELFRFLAACAGAGCPALLTLSVVGRVTLTPPDPMDGRVAGAFNAHQCRSTERGRLLGPDAPALAADELARLGAAVHVRPSPWRLGNSYAELAAEWFAGWVAAAFEQEPDLARESGDYAARRLAQARAGGLDVTVEHADLLILP